MIMVTSSAIVSAQSGSVGINTPDPTEMLDVNGIGRMRILPENGTSNAIYTQPDGTKSVLQNQPFKAVKTIVADHNGVLGFINGMPGQGPIIIAGADGRDAIVTSYTVSARNGLIQNTPALTSKSFTLSKRSLVTFSFSISTHDIVTYNGTSLTDSTTKRIGAELHLNNTDLIKSGIPFTNTGNHYADGYFYINGNRTIVLNPGNYTVDLVGNVFSYDGDNIGLRATFGATTSDQLDIIAVPF